MLYTNVSLLFIILVVPFCSFIVFCHMFFFCVIVIFFFTGASRSRQAVILYEMTYIIISGLINDWKFRSDAAVEQWLLNLF